MVGKGAERKKLTVGEEYVLDSFIPLKDPAKISGTLAAPEGMNKGGEVGNYQPSYVQGKVEGNRERQMQLALLDTSFGLSFGDYELLLPCYRFRWQDVCGPEQLNALELVGSEILAETMPKLLALDAFTEDGFMRLTFLTAEKPYGTLMAYEGEDVAELLKEFIWKRRGMAASAAGSLTAWCGEEGGGSSDCYSCWCRATEGKRSG